MPKTIFGGEHAKLVGALVEARKRAGLTQEELAARIGRDQTFVSLIERGQRRVDVIEFISIAKAMGNDPATLFRDVLGRIAL
jgi:transcriptional regulator with XRE-family HTH domain